MTSIHSLTVCVASEEAIKLDCIARGEPPRTCILTESKLDGVPFYEIQVVEGAEPQTLELTLPIEVDTEHQVQSGSPV